MTPPNPIDVKPPEGTVNPTPPAAAPAVPPAPVVKPGEPAPVAPAQPGVTPVGGEPTPTQGAVPLAALQEERSKRQAMEAEVTQLRQIVAGQAPAAPQQQPTMPQSPMGQPQMAELDQLWDSDPRKAVEQTIAMYGDWRDRIDAGLEIQATQMEQKYADFKNYRGGAMAYVRSLPTNQRSQPGVLEMAYYITRGQNVDTILKQQEADMYQKFQAGQLAGSIGQPAGTYTQPAVPANTVTLNDEQLRVADAMGLSPEQYASQIKGV